MVEKVINLNDMSQVRDDASISKMVSDAMAGGPKSTKVTFYDHATGEKLGEFHNKVVISGSVFNARKAWGTVPPVRFPSYNDEMALENSHTAGTEPMNVPKVCLFCVGDGGCGATPKDVLTVPYTGRITPAPAYPKDKEEFKSDMIMPFRFVNEDEDLNPDLRKYYFGRKVFRDLGKIGYYFKVFDTTPQMHLRYADGTQITDNVYEYTSEYAAECYVETRLRINRLDFRDYFEEILGWDKARISDISLCYAWYDDTIDDYKWYQDIFPYTKLNFPYEWLVDSTKGIDIQYCAFY